MSLIRKIVGENVAGGGANNPFNYELDCGSCKRMLGYLGTFLVREATVEECAALFKIGVVVGLGDFYRRAHCGYCHAQTFVVSDERVIVQPAARVGLTCALCGRADRATESLVATAVKMVS
jgi:hypothetical protein